MKPALLVLALIAVPIVELYVILQVGQQIGALATVVLLVAVSLLGAALLRREGARAWRAFREATLRGRVPAREVADGFLVLLAGALLLTPGFATDVVGLLLLLPPVRAVLRRWLTSYATRAMIDGLTAGPPGGGPGRPPGRGSERVIDGDVVEDP
ncbi:MAG TPA: FxsA family protein [Mycobacteriales bacterium]|nr:FxsA family protein [Mycobacteriales bacterium]